MRGAVAFAAVVCCIAASAAHADGDPASDTLVQQNVFFSYQAASRPARTALQRAVTTVYLHGDRLKVAVILDPTDLGSVGSLFGKPDAYAHFLAIELGLWYVGPLLVVMPAGFGIYDGGRPTTAEESVLDGLHVDATSPDDFVNSAVVAVERLAAAGALRSADVRAPLVTAHPAFAKRGKPARLRFDLFDDSGRSEAVVRVYANRRLLATLPSPMRFAVGTRPAEVRWPVPPKLVSRRLRFCVVATDPGGNRTDPVCAPFLRIR
jgi:hypothetical protein